MIDHSETDFPTQSQKERNFVHEEDIHRQIYFTVEFQVLLWDFHDVPNHRNGGSARGFTFQGSNVLTPDLHGDIDVLNSDGAVLNLVAAHYPLEVFPRWVIQCLVQGLCFLGTAELSLGESFFVRGYSRIG